MMIYALGYSLESVRVVLSNEINDVHIYKQVNSSSNCFFTCISIKNQDVKKKVLLSQAENEELEKNIDYKGSFVVEDKLNLLFVYHEEKKLETYRELYLPTFKAKREAAKNLVRACNVSHFPKEWVCLLLKDRNINIDEARDIYFNYFIDFRELDIVLNKKVDAYGELGEIVFDILSDDYKKLHKIQKYPKDLRLFYKKLTIDGFHSYAEFYKFLSMLPEKLQNEQTLWYRIKLILLRIIRVIKKYSMPVIIAFIVVLACIYSIGQIRTRSIQKAQNEKLKEESGVYKKLYTIGTVEIEKDK